MADLRSILPSFVAVSAAVVTVSFAALLQWRSAGYVFEAGFWFEDIAVDRALQGSPLGAIEAKEEMETIKSIARSELLTAFSGLRIVVSENPRAHYRVRVVEQFPPKAGPPRAAAESRPMGLLGGEGAVSFQTVARFAIHYAPPGADRAVIIEAIGRGLGRAAAHEFAHQILWPSDLHRSHDVRSYEYATADRMEQYYGPMHWDTAWPLLVRKLGE